MRIMIHGDVGTFHTVTGLKVQLKQAEVATLLPVFYWAMEWVCCCTSIR